MLSKYDHRKKCDYSSISVILIHLVSLSFLYGCSTAHQNARAFLKSGDYTAAAQAYQNILKETPNDPDAREGIQKAREGLIDKRLLSVRFSRLGGNRDEALASLKQLMADEMNWKVFPTGPVFTTQTEELHEALNQASKIIGAYLKSGYPVPARLYFERYAKVFWQGETLKSYQNLGTTINAMGKQSCDTFYKGTTPKEFYYGKFLEEYCNYWSDNKQRLSQYDNPAYLAEHYSSISITTNVEDLPPEIIENFRSDFFRALQGTPYFDPKGLRDLPVTLSGMFSNVHTESPTLLSKEYTTKEPYTTYIPVMKTRQVPYSCPKMAFDFSSGQSYLVDSTCYRNDYYFEQEPITAYRTVPHIYQYAGQQFRQNLMLLVNAKALADSHEITVVINEQESKTGIAHNETVPDIGLFPQSMVLLEPVEWIKNKSANAGTNLGNKLQQLWEKLYCKAQKQTHSAVDSGENVQKCLRAEGGDQYEFVDQWYKTYLGVPYSDVKDVLRE